MSQQKTILSCLWLGITAGSGLALASESKEAVKGTAGSASLAAVSQLPVLHQLPDFSLTDQDKKIVNLESLRGKIWVADFIYTSCGDECPLMTTKMLGLQRAFASVSELRFISFSTDPVRDTPEILKSYAQKFRADESSWRFVTGPKLAITNLSTQGFWLPASVKGYAHTGNFALVDRHARVRGYYSSTTPKALAKLREDIEALSLSAD